MAKIKLLMRMSDILEYGSQDDSYDFSIKGHSVNHHTLTLKGVEDVASDDNRKVTVH